MKKFLGLPLLLLGVLFLRGFLEGSEMRLYDYLGKYYFTPEFLQNADLTDWLLPMRPFGGLWVATSSVPTFWITRFLTPAQTWYLFQILVILVSFSLSWMVFKSCVFSYTLAICLGFGTQLYHVYQIPGIIAAPLLYIYYCLLLFCLWKVIESNENQLFWRTSFFVCLVVCALSSDGWLNFWGFLLISSIHLLLFFGYTKQDLFRKRIMFVLYSSIFILAGYLLTKTQFSMKGSISLGSEEDVIFNYSHPLIMVEDLIGNIFLYTYIVITNFLPPFVVFSNSLFFFGPSKLIEFQAGYHGQYSHLVAMNYFFFWRYLAGAAFVIFYYILFKAMKRAYQGSYDYLIVSIFMIMMATPPVHILIKFRPYSTFPFLGYKVIVGTLGSALLISFIVMKAYDFFKGRIIASLIVLVAWGVIFSGTFFRPAYLGQMNELVGMNYLGPYPDPMATLMKFLFR